MEKWMLLVTALGSIATTGALFLAWRMLRENQLLRLAQTEPAISLHLERGRHLNLMNLVIQNRGPGIARDLQWEVSPSVAELKKHAVDLESLQLLKGFSHLAPMQRIDTFFGAAVELLAKNCPPVVVTVRFLNCRNEQRVETFILNPAQFAGLTEVGEPALESMKKSVEKIAQRLDRITSQGRIRVAVVAGEKPWLWNVRAMREDLEAEIEASEPSIADSSPAESVEVTNRAS